MYKRCQITEMILNITKMMFHDKPVVPGSSLSLLFAND